MKRSVLTGAAAAFGLCSTLLLGSALAQQPAPPPTDEELRAGFSAADTNRDGHVDIDEAVADAILAFGRADANRDSFLTMQELPRHDPTRFKRADRDGDGKLSVGEVAAERVFEFFLVDTNRNGVVTLEELRVYSVNVRNQRK